MSNDLIENPSPRCPCLVILDTSGSMDGKPIRELNEGINLFIRALREDEVASFSVEVAFLRAGGDVEEILPFTVASEINECAPLPAYGNTPLGRAVELGLDMLERRKNEYKKMVLHITNHG